MNIMHYLGNGSLVGFYTLGFVAIFACLRVITLANPVHAILSLIVSLISIAGIFFILGAPFAGALQIIVYAGAILVLFVFVIMMLNLGITNDARESRWLASEVWAVPAGLTFIVAVVLFALLGIGAPDTDSVANNVIGDVVGIGVGDVPPKIVGISLFTEYLLLVEVAALLLLAALVAAYHIGKRALDDENSSHSSVLVDAKSGYDSTEISVDEYDDTDVTDAVRYAKPYDYEPVDPSDFEQNSTAPGNVKVIKEVR